MKSPDYPHWAEIQILKLYKEGVPIEFICKKNYKDLLPSETRGFVYRVILEDTMKRQKESQESDE